MSFSAAPFALTNRRVLITGATKGIGLAMARLFGAAGARVIVSGEHATDCDRVVQDIVATGGSSIALSCDVRDRGALDALVDAAWSVFDGLDVLICNAGVPGPHASLSDIDDGDFEAVFDVNLRHALRLSAMIAPRMADAGGGAIILTSSIAGLRGNKAIGLYGMSKAALAQLARNLAVEWGPRNVRANAIAPGLIATDWAKNIVANEDLMRRRLELTPLRRLGDPSEVAGVALFLASEASAFITGQVIVVDGGALITDGN